MARKAPAELSRKVRVFFGLGVATVAALFLRASQIGAPGGHSDFGAVWFGARTMLHRQNPYVLVGPGLQFDWPFNLNYPATALVAAIPLSILPEQFASLVFVFVSCFLLAYGATRDGWNRIWIFPSAAFIIAARSGQWSPLIASAYFLPFVGFLLPAKPSIGLAPLMSDANRIRWKSCLIGGFLLASIAFVLLPSWPLEWLKVLRHNWEFSAPIARIGGFVLVLALLKWRQREARFLFVLALVPQVSSWYEGLLPMLVGRTKREIQLLSLTNSLGYILLIPLAFSSPTREVASSDIGRMMVAFCYLPALIVVLRRPGKSYCAPT